MSAFSSIGGRVLPRRLARFKIPCAPLALKKYFGGADGSSTCHKKDTAASLGHAEKLSIEHAPGNASAGSKHSTSGCPFCPWRLERTFFTGKSAQKAAEGIVAGGEHAGHVFPHEQRRRLAGLLSNSINCI